MKTRPSTSFGLPAVLVATMTWSCASAQTLEVPAGFTIDELATGLDGVRTLKIGPDDQLYAVQSDDGRVVRLDPTTGDGPTEVVGDLNRPYGLAFHDGWMYVGERHQVVRYRGPDYRTSEIVVPGLPTGGGHWTREIVFGDDGLLYVSVGSSCNVCEEDDERRAAILRYAPDGSGYQRFAWGLRNSVGLDFHPQTGELYATDNGRDLLGDDIPPCELNRVLEGGFYGWPFAYGDRIPDPDYGVDHSEQIAGSQPPEHGFGAHTAPLGMVFYRGTAFPEPYRSSAYVAQHGSWNRSVKSGYRVVRLEWDAQGRVSETDFVLGFERDEQVIGRPVDVAVGPEGALYISDDYSGTIYRVRWTGADRE